MEYAQKLVYQSNYWYNDGLAKAKIRDMSGAVTSLKKSLQFNRDNIAARNLLGLVYYGRGEVGEALVEWILSKNLKSHENIAGYYIQKIQKNPADLAAINQAIRRYNQSLVYCQQGGEDLAVIQLKKAIAAFPGFLRAHQLLALIYLHTEQYTKARQVLKEANKLDTTNDITLRYMHELTHARRRGNQGKKPDKGQTVSYKIGNETIIQPAVSGKEGLTRSVVINILIGAVVGACFMWFLVMPAVNKKTANESNKQVIEFSNKIAEEEAQIAALKTELESYRAASEESQNAQQTAASTKESYEIVIEIDTHYRNEDMSDAAMTEQLQKVNPEALGTLGRERYEEMTKKIYARYGEVLYQTAQENYDVANYTDAIANLTTLMKMDEGYDEGRAMALLSRAYEAGGDGENAKLWKEKVKEKYPNADTSGEDEES